MGPNTPPSSFCCCPICEKDVLYERFLSLACKKPHHLGSSSGASAAVRSSLPFPLENLFNLSTGPGRKRGSGSPSKTDWPRPQIDGSSSDRDSHGQAEIVRRPRKTSRTISHTFWFIGGKYPREKLSDWAPGNDGTRSVGHHPQILPIFHIKRSGKREGEPSPLALHIRSPSSFFGWGALPLLSSSSSVPSICMQMICQDKKSSPISPTQRYERTLVHLLFLPLGLSTLSLLGCGTEVGGAFSGDPADPRRDVFLESQYPLVMGRKRDRYLEGPPAAKASHPNSLPPS